MLKDLVKQSLGMAWPMMAMRLLVALTNFYAMWLLSRLGSLEFAAGAIIFVMQTTVTVIMAGILYSISPIVARAFGAKDHRKVGAIAQQGWMLSIFLTIPAILILWFARDILLACGQSYQIAVIVGEYFHTYIWAVIPMYFFSTNQMVLSGIGKQRLALSASLLGSVFLFVVAYIFSAGKFGLPALGVQGIALGMATSIWAGLIFSSVCLFSSRFAEFEFFKWRLKQSRGILKQIFSIGWPIVLQIGGELFSWFVVTLLIGWLGAQALSAQQIVNQYNILVIIPVMGLMQASGILVGQASGAKQYHLVKRIGFVNMGIGLVIMLAVMVIYLAIPKTLISVYLSPYDPQNALIVHWAILLLALTAFSLLFDTIRNITMGALRGVYDSRYPMYLSLIFTWLIGLPLGYYFAFPHHLGVIGFAIANLIGVTIAALVLIWRWHSKVHHLIEKAERSDQKAK